MTKFRQPAFTMIELMVVVGIIAVLAGALLVAGNAVIQRGRAQNTRMIISVIDNALGEFSQRQKGNPTLARRSAYKDRYGYFPPDEIEVFVSGIPTLPNSNKALVPGDGRVVTGGTGGTSFDPMTWQTTPYANDQLRAEGNRDIAAMMLAFDLFGDESRMMIDKLPAENIIVPQTPEGIPLLFLDRNDNQTYDEMIDQPLRYVVDNWQTPLSYMAQRDFSVEGTNVETTSSNHPNWNEASTTLIGLNGARPIVFSYGPNGRDQLDEQIVLAGRAGGSGGQPSTVVDDFVDNNLVDSPLNDDNIYADETLRDKFRRGSR
ncbi:MAG: type II secretion system protein [Phycisphaerae bacterium]